ncbi:glycolate oxidase subunit GlcD [Pseudomonas putida S11]|nr:glycolate oxidase subunit GlcD [Pseudomonas putida S11]
MNILYDERVDGALPDVDRAALLQALRAALPDLEILHREEDLKPYECDGLSAYRTVPLLVVLPERLEQVQALLRLCHQRGVPVVARGAGTGLSGGALPLAKGILLVMARFNRILEVNPQGRFARVQPGVRNLAISQAAAPHGLYLRAGPILADSLLHRRQCRGERRWRALPEVRPDRAQPAKGGNPHGRGRTPYPRQRCPGQPRFRPAGTVHRL